MPKRSSQSKIEHYAKKIRKIEEKELRRRRIIRPLDTSSDDEGKEISGEAVNNIDTTTEPLPTFNLETTQDIELTGPDISEKNEVLDPELLSALGESTAERPDYGENIHDSLTKLWTPLLKKRLSKDSKEQLLREYLIPDNCRLLQAPKLNAEISAAVPDMVRNRDKTLNTSQQQLGSGITAINRGMDLLLKTNDRVQAMKHFSNGCRLLCDSHYVSTQRRIRLVTPSLDKSILHMISESERDKLFFGSTLSEKIKTAKAIEKQGISIKKSNKPQKFAALHTSNRPSSYQGNWVAPPRYLSSNRGVGGVVATADHR